MKRLFLVSAIILSLGIMVPVFATGTEITGNGSTTETGSMNITYGVTSGYTVKIPADLKLEDTTAVERTISAENVMIDYGTSLKVAIKSSNYADSKWYLVDSAAGTSNKVEYIIKDGETAVINDQIILEVEAGADELKGSNTLTFQVPTVPTKAGNYKDTLTFSVSVGAPTAAVSME